MIYRVVLKVSYNEAFFDFDSLDQACNFARVAVEHSVKSEDQKKIGKISVMVINSAINEQEEEE